MRKNNFLSLAILMSMHLIFFMIPISLVHASLEADFSGWWYDASLPGTGVSIEFSDESNWFLAWYVFDQRGLTTWYTASGTMTDTNNFSGDLLKWTGWSWGQSYSSPIYERIGKIEGNIIVSPEKKIALSWELDDGHSSGSLSLTNFMEDVAGGYPDSRHLTGWWYDPNYNGMGFFIEARGGTMFLAWYNYREDGTARWLTSSGNFPDGAITYNGVMSSWENGQIIGGEYRSPIKLSNRENVKITFSSATRATLEVDNTVLHLQKFFESDHKSDEKGCIEITYGPSEIMPLKIVPHVSIINRKTKEKIKELSIDFMAACIYDLNSLLVGCWKDIEVTNRQVTSIKITIDDTDYDANDYYYPQDKCD